MTQTILKMVQNSEAELGLPQSVSVFGPGVQDTTGIQMGALANRVLDELRRMNRWTVLQAEFNIVVSVPIVTVGTMAANSAVITGIPSTAGLTNRDWQVIGANIPVAARINTVDSPTQVTMTMQNSNTSAVTGTPITFAKDTYSLPTGFIDWFQNRTFWDRTNRWELIGPDSPQMDQWHRSGIVATGPRRHYRILFGTDPSTGAIIDMVRFWPAPAEIVNPLQFVFEYMQSTAVALNGTPNYVQYFTTDTDTCLLDDNAITMGIKWMFWETKGFGSYITLQNRWVDYVERLAARDGAAPTLKLVPRQNPIFISPNNVQDGFYPGPTGPNTA